MKVAVVGSRTFDNYDLLREKLETHNITEIISGGAKGADSLAEEYAKKRNIPVTIYLPDWKTLGRKAGYMRNIQIVEAAELVIAFWDGSSRGTQHSINYAKKIGTPVIIHRF